MLFFATGKEEMQMKKSYYRMAVIIGVVLILSVAMLYLWQQIQFAGEECFAMSFTAQKPGYYTLLIEHDQMEAEKCTLSIYINDIFSRKAAFSRTLQEPASVPVYLKKGKNKISLRMCQGDQETKIYRIDVIERTAPTKMIIAPHEDDEVLAFAGSIMHMLEAGDDVIVVLMTNGDWKGKKMGMERLVESARALDLLGLPRENIIMMGYPDAELLQLFSAGDSRKVLDLELGEEYTYGNPEYHLYDFHTLQHGKPAAMSGSSIRQDLLDILNVHMPSEIYLTSQYDLHSDHAASYLLTIEMLEKLWKQSAYTPLLHETIVHGFDDALWPERLILSEDGEPVIRAFTPPFPQEDMPFVWEDAVHIHLTPEMIERKRKAIGMYYTQNVVMGWAEQNDAYLKSDEFYWTKVFAP